MLLKVKTSRVFDVQEAAPLRHVLFPLPEMGASYRRMGVSLRQGERVAPLGYQEGLI